MQSTATVRPQPRFHEGERAVQRRAGVERVVAQIGRSIVSWIPPEYAEFLRAQPFVVVAGRDAQAQMWASLIVGARVLPASSMIAGSCSLVLSDRRTRSPWRSARQAQLPRTGSLAVCGAVHDIWV